MGSNTFVEINATNIGWRREEGHEAIEKRLSDVGEPKRPGALFPTKLRTPVKLVEPPN